MKRILLLPALAIGLLACPPLSAQDTSANQPPPRPDNATGVCRDGTYTTESARKSACKDHRGIKRWFPAAPSPTPPPAPPADSGAAPPSANPPVPQSTPSKTTQAREQSLSAAKAASDASSATGSLPTQSIAGPTSQSSAPTTDAGTRRRTARRRPAPGGGPGLVWLNPASNTYHCPGTAYYGRTRNGSYMSETDAKSKGARIAHGESCPAQ